MTKLRKAELSQTDVILFSLLSAVKNQATGHLFLNDENEFPESRTVIEKGVEWEYHNNDDMETIQTTGPLRYTVLVMVSHLYTLRSLASTND
jgi:hypothetical protein